MNNVSLIGRLTSDPEIRYTQIENIMVAQFILAVNRAYAKQGEERQADFITIVACNKTAEFCSKYFRKGQQIGVTGRIETGSYDDKDGKKVYTTKVIAEHVYFADSNKNENNNNTNDPFANSTPPSTITDDDLPF